MRVNTWPVVVDQKNLVAVNKDPDANIFKDARFGVVGDWEKVLPALTQQLKELM